MDNMREGRPFRNCGAVKNEVYFSSVEFSIYEFPTRTFSFNHEINYIIHVVR